MNCYYHPEKNAVASCQHCGRHLCQECADKYSPCLCEDCYKVLRQKEIDDLKAAKGQLVKTLVISCILAFICVMITAYDGNENFPWIISLIAFFAPWGWNYGNVLGLTWFFNLNPTGCLFMMLIYLFRAIVSAIIGVFCFIAAIVKFQKIRDAERTAEIEIGDRQ
ncbi:MAG: hypothetical protein IJ222_00675 [Bacteroidales bacterium]|nr:hypothetical protein [Bacteroidales bacterium]